MRVVMSIGTRLEAWACAHLAFSELVDVWPYLLDDKFGDACLRVLPPCSLEDFDDDDCLRVALLLRLHVKLCDDLPVPIDLTAANSVDGSPFTSFRIQTVRDRVKGDKRVAFTPDDDPFDEDFGTPYFVLHGIGRDKGQEHVADRRTYAEIAGLAQCLSPGAAFPEYPIARLKSR